MSLGGVDAATVAALLSSGSASTETLDKVVSLVSIVVNAMDVGESQLRIFAWGDSTTLECDNAPIVITKTDSPNGACPDEWVNASCSCLSDLAGSTSWTIPVALLTPDDSSGSGSSAVLPTNITVASATSIDRMFIPKDLTSLSLVGQSASPLGIDVETGGVTSVIQGFVVALGASQLANFEMVNITLTSASIDASFVPSTVTNITLQNCALSELSSNVFASRHDALAYLDLSVNDLSGLSLGLSASVNSSTIQSVNLSYNSLASIPSDLFLLDHLEYLDLRGNPITDVKVTASQLALLQGLSLFEIDAIDLSARASCSGGTWTKVQDVSFCVTADPSNSGGTIATSSEESSSSNTAVYGGIGGGVGLVVLIVLVVIGVRARRKRLANQDAQREAGGGKRWTGGDKHGHVGSHNDDEFDGSTMSLSGPAELLSHPLIVMNRLPMADVDVRASISKGGFGEVFEGYYLGRHVAVKKVHPYYQNDPRRVEMFLHEIVLMAALQHPRIVEFVGVSWSALRHLLAVTEFMDNGDLRSVMLQYKRGRHPSEPTRSSRTNSSGNRTSVLFSGGRSSHSNSTGDSSASGSTGSERLTWESHKLKWALHIAESLVYLHSLQPAVIHRDLKSKNVLVDANMDAKLSDFGISREHSVDETHMTTGVGTSFWIAPEVLLGGYYDEKADVFSFGIVLSELDTEDYPYWNYTKSSNGSGQPGSGSSQTSGDSRPRGLHQHAILGMVAAGELRPTFSTTCPLGVLQIAELCLQSDPEARPTSAMLFHMLQQVQAEPKPFARIGPAKNSPTASSRSRGDSFY